MTQTNQVVLATANEKKRRELAQLVSPQIALITQMELGISSPPETGFTFVENALIKARHAAQQSGLPALADDSGLEVDTLRGAPGIYSSRFAGEGASDADNVDKLLREMQHHENRSARFVCVMVYLRHAMDPVPLIAQGFWEGQILHAPQGSEGFGYDPVFYVPDRDCSAAQLKADEKNRVSHRHAAVIQLNELLEQHH